MLRRQIVILAALLVFAGPSALAQQNRMYKCKDEKGKIFYTQTPPNECLGKEMQELSGQANVVRKLDAALTPKQLLEREAEEKKRKEDEALAKEEGRKNQALLNTYSSEKDIEEGRVRALKQGEEAIKQTEKRITEAQKRQKDLAAEKEFYLKKPMPKKLQDDITNNDFELKQQQGLLEAKKKELGEINAKYDADKRRYLELTSKGNKPSSAQSR
jgi:Domain of unknown function (DUF4124)